MSDSSSEEDEPISFRQTNSMVSDGNIIQGINSELESEFLES